MKKFGLFSLLCLAVMSFGSLALAATANPLPTSPGYMVLPFHISGQYTATATNVVKFKLPYPASVVHVSATARASGGTTPTLTVDIKEAGTTILSTPISITAGTVADGTVTDTKIADEALVTADFTIGGTSPTWNDVTLLLVLKRL